MDSEMWEQRRRRAAQIAGKVRQARDDAGLSNSELARRADLPRRTVVRITNGRNTSWIQHETLAALANATGKPIEYFALAQASPAVRHAAEALVEALVDDLRLAVAAHLGRERERDEEETHSGAV